MKNSSEPKFRNQILLGLKHSAVITLPILSSLRQKGRLTPKLVVRSNRCRGQSAWQSSAWSLSLTAHVPVTASQSRSSLAEEERGLLWLKKEKTRQRLYYCAL